MSQMVFHVRASWLALVLILMAVWPLHAQRDITNIPDPDPEIERQSFQVADGFEVNLFAADPLLAKPIQMNFDPAGRLWVASSEVYPQIKPGHEANDKILILEDRDGDGQAPTRRPSSPTACSSPPASSRATAEPTSPTAPSSVHFADTEGDGQADRHRVVLSGFGTEDTHHILHTLRWGPDGMLYFNQSIYIHSHIETPHGVRRLGRRRHLAISAGDPAAGSLLHGLVNPWGHHFRPLGAIVRHRRSRRRGHQLRRCREPPTPGRRAPVASSTGSIPAAPSTAGLEILSGRHLPEDWRGNLLTNDFRGHRVCRFVLTEDGAGFAARQKAELIKTNHPAFRPIDIKMGPDGAIYIADWYNPIIQHGEVDFRDPRRDQTHGRIWRVTAKGRPLVPRPQLVGATPRNCSKHSKPPKTGPASKRSASSRNAVLR